MERDQEALMRAYTDPRLEDARACPFCGGKNLAVFPGPRKAMFRRKTKRVVCAKCQAQGPIGRSEAHAVIVWNGDFTRTMDANGKINPPDQGNDS